MRIVHVNAGNLYGGIESMLLTFARHRNEAPGLEQRFALCFEGRLSRGLTDSGVAPEMLGGARFSRPWSLRRPRARLMDLVERHRIDAVVCHGSWCHVAFGGAVRATGARLVAWLHAPPSSRRWLEALATRTAPDVVIANSEFTASSARLLFPHVPSSVVFCPVERTRIPDRARDAVRIELGTASDEAVIVAACRLEPWKGLHVLVAALGRLPPGARWECWIAGGAQRPSEQRYLRELEALATRVGVRHRVRFLGAREDVARLLAGADVYCQPNVEPEPFGISFVEALHAGLPVVTAPIGGALEVLDESCAVFAPSRPPELAAALTALIEDGRLRARLGATGPARAHRLCDPATALRALAASLRSSPAGLRGMG